MKTLVNNIEQSIDRVINGYASQYINCIDSNNNPVTIRVSNHFANPSRMNDNDISLVINIPEKDNNDDQHCSFSVSKKTFHDIKNQYLLDENGSFYEQFKSVEELLTWHEIIF